MPSNIVQIAALGAFAAIVFIYTEKLGDEIVQKFFERK
jgi:hypothetical protein